jgi:hypothetical protein
MKHSILKTGITEVINTVDADTGELMDTEIRKHTYMANTKEEFFIGYSALIGAFMEMTQAEIRVFGYLLRYAKGVKFDISKKMRVEMGDVIKLNERTILNTLPALEDKQIIYKYDSGLYQLNPRYAFQGSTVDRNNALKTIIELGCKDC